MTTGASAPQASRFNNGDQFGERHPNIEQRTDKRSDKHPRKPADTVDSSDPHKTAKLTGEDAAYEPEGGDT